MNIYLSIILLLFVSCSEKKNVKEPTSDNKLSEQITFDSTSWTYEATMIVNDCRKKVLFLSYPVDSGRKFYSEIRYQTDSPALTHGYGAHLGPTLAYEIPYIKTLWDTLNKKIRIKLNGASIGNPSEYKDVLNNYVTLLQNAPSWQNQLRKKRKDDYPYALIEEILGTGNVYHPFDSLLQTYGYSIEGYSTEKHYFLSKDKLKAYGYDTSSLIPIPGMCDISLKQNE
jgi:hypothetical protein